MSHASALHASALCRSMSMFMLSQVHVLALRTAWQQNERPIIEGMPAIPW